MKTRTIPLTHGRKKCVHFAGRKEWGQTEREIITVVMKGTGRRVAEINRKVGNTEHGFPLIYDTSRVSMDIF